MPVITPVAAQFHALAVLLAGAGVLPLQREEEEVNT